MHTTAEPIENAPIWTPANPVSIREAILERVPEYPNFTRDIKIANGMADIALRWKTMRFSQTLAIQNLSADEVAAIVENGFAEWLLKIITINPDPELQKVNPKAETVIRDMRRWAAKKGYYHGEVE